MIRNIRSIRSIHKCGSHDHQRYYPVRHQGPNLSRLRCFPVGKSCTESSQFIPSTVERQKIDSPSQDSRQLASLILFILSRILSYPEFIHERNRYAFLHLFPRNRTKSTEPKDKRTKCLNMDKFSSCAGQC